ncbi:hypothetical protein VFPPC_16480 [Pochonia chlamydosporia 170]|uniref:Uncharacterized protein n=1 Tax=Pochonia chlamydosporia 170 TaxID=1380566 RepID=A0A179FD55_METCM|nr:hypothetical protein VFPPC_16480 [Pochonia chlamydosporia 170]OAQ63505.1 hypothetical protein VFPPC_16480 [Pochonia chlamydosporia 170]
MAVWFFSAAKAVAELHCRYTCVVNHDDQHHRVQFPGEGHGNGHGVCNLCIFCKSDPVSAPTLIQAAALTKWMTKQPVSAICVTEVLRRAITKLTNH